jgi:hypothetical protein
MPDDKLTIARREARKRHAEKIRKDPEKWGAYLAKKREWRMRTRERRLALERAWKKRNPDKRKAYKAKYETANPDKVRQWGRTAYLRNREKRLEACKQYREENKATILERERQRRLANPEKMRTWQRDWRTKNPASSMWSSTKKSARVQGVPFDLDKEWFSERLLDGTCEMSGLPFEVERGIGFGRNPNAPSVDRIKAGGPYTKANCRLILWGLNRALSNLGEDYYLKIARAILVKRGEMLRPEDARMAA